MPCLTYTGSLIGIAQGVAWTLLALLAVLIKYEAWGVEPEGLEAAILERYVTGIPSGDVIVTPDTIVYFLFAYLIASATWLVLSAWMLYACLRRKMATLQTIVPIWCACVYVVSLLDLILTVLLAADYAYVTSGDVAATDSVALATGTAMALAARGFTLWIVNVATSTCLLVSRYNNKTTSPILQRHLDAYESNKGRDNYGFEWGEGRRSVTSSSVTAQTTNEPLAKIGRVRLNAPPTKVVAAPLPPSTFLHPREPPPDYSPVLEKRGGASALKLRTQNAYGTQF